MLSGVVETTFKFGTANIGIVFGTAKRKMRKFAENLTAMFEKEIETFYRNLDRLREENPLGGYAVIKGDQVLDVWLNDLDALKEGFKAYGPDAKFMIRDISDRPIDIRQFGCASAKISL